MYERKLKLWQEAGLLDEAQAARIRAWEADHSRPLALWAVIGIAALAIGLGVVLVVAANWEEIPGMVRLALHLALLAGTLGWLWRRGDRMARAQPWGLEALLFVTAMLGMTFLAHVGQVYQTTSPLWQPLALWLALMGPLLLLRGQSWLAAMLLFATSVYAVWDYAEPAGAVWGRSDRPGALAVTVVTALPLLYAPLAAWWRGRSARPAFWLRLEQVGFAYAVGGTSLIAIASVDKSFDSGSNEFVSFGMLALRAVIALAAGGAIAAARPGKSGQATGGILALCAMVLLLAYPLSGSQVVAALLFMALWAGIAGASLHAGWRGVFQLAVAVIALRLIVLSFELDDDLLTSGAGLIFSGLLILGIAWGAMRIARRFAPPRESEA
ncbi:DUF2157 domain-containing protein [Novosphingobium sp. B 225]|uniref:DUF2157 domain-containing protein n=1 Tax=Novosphingobium sp. B 225 TaxID=1961849 RepID=UPI000B4A5CF0|nr:DUF2157 domain-containing protein [Novosphingobium sp. B 225]